jgi:competence protein ComEA
MHRDAGTRNGTVRKSAARNENVRESTARNGGGTVQELRNPHSLVLADLNGVRDADTLQRPPMPRLGISAHSLGAIVFVLICAVAASLTLLVVQSRNFEAYASGLEQEVAKAAKSSHSSEEASVPQASGKGANGSKGNDDESAGSSSGDGAADGSGNPASSGERTESKNSSGHAQAQSPQDTRIDLNTATAAQLDTVKGIGPVTAQKIIDYRSSNGRFSSVDELMNVSGIGPKTLEKMRSMLVVR